MSSVNLMGNKLLNFYQKECLNLINHTRIMDAKLFYLKKLLLLNLLVSARLNNNKKEQIRFD